MAMDAKELKHILSEHKKWVKSNGEKGERANLQGADLNGANLQGADLRWANLQGADIDFSCWPLWCGSNSVKVDRKIAAQLAAHFCVLDCDDPDYQKARKAILKFAKTSHQAADLGL
jgi:uncharacterized protein YjbI with pentapeptide repeats